jgi:hypothetical protein
VSPFLHTSPPPYCVIERLYPVGASFNSGFGVSFISGVGATSTSAVGAASISEVSSIY